MNDAAFAESCNHPDPTQLAQQLVGWFDQKKRYVIALSGGVDSAVVAMATHLSGVSAQLATARSSAVSGIERADVERLLVSVPLSHVFIDTQELQDANYQANSSSRCYYCKSELFSQIASRFPGWTILTGTNQDDLGDFRPGLRAAAEASVQQPLVDLGIGKQGVRALAAHWNLHVADKPASPCLASRIAHGVPVTSERLGMVEQAESVLRGLGLRTFRVRLHADEVARVEVPEAQLASVFAQRALVTAKLKAIGFRFVTLDLEGFRSGSLNPLVELTIPS